MGEIIPFVTARDAHKQLAALKGDLLTRARRDRRVTDLQFRIYAEDLDHAHRSIGPKFGQLWPSPTSVANLVNAHVRTVQAARRHMRRLGYLEQVSLGGGRSLNGTAATAIYRVPGLVPILPSTSASDGTLTSAPDGTLTSAPDGTLTSALALTKPIDTNVGKTSTSCSLSSARESSPREDLQNWMPNDASFASAHKRGYEAIWIADQIERFRDHHLAKGSVFAKIDPAWRNWLRRAFELDDDPPRPPRELSSAMEDEIRAHPEGEPVRRLINFIGFAAYRSFFHGVRFRGARDGTVYLAAPSPFIRAKLIEREQAIRAAWGVEHVDIAVVASDGQG
jgi:hypothetical protein